MIRKRIRARLSDWSNTKMRPEVGEWLREHGFVWSVETEPAAFHALYDSAVRAGMERAARICDDTKTAGGAGHVLIEVAAAIREAAK